MLISEVQQEIDRRFATGEAAAAIVDHICQLNLATELEIDAMNYIENHKNGSPHFTPSDVGNSERFVRDHQNDVRYCHDRRNWLIWSGTHWRWDDSNRIKKLAEATVRSIYTEASAAEDADKAKEIAKHAIRSESSQRINDMLTLAQHKLPVHIRELDANEWLLNVQNGTIDLRTGEKKPHDPDDFITRIISMDYDPKATSEEWNFFLARIFDKDVALIDYVQRGIGYSATGNQGEQIFFFCHGAGFNGKSQFLVAIGNVLGEYASEVPPSAFMIEKNKSAAGPNEAIASLYRVRFLASTEVEEGQKLAYGLLKRMTGGEKLWCEHKYERGFNFTPEYKLWLAGNHEPRITDTTPSIWNRVKKIPFTVTIPLEERIKDYGVKLAREHGEAILAWIVQGVVHWFTSGIPEPDKVRVATQTYRDGQDVLHEYLAECCTFQPSASITVAELYTDYKAWCDRNNTYCIGKGKFDERLLEKGIRKDRGNYNKMCWYGIRLLTEEERVTPVTNVTYFSENNIREHIQEKVSGETVTEVTEITPSDEKQEALPEVGNEQPNF